MNEEYANYNYQTITCPIKNEYGVTIGERTKTTYKLCTKDCKYQHNWNELKKYLEDEYEKLHGAIYSTNAVFLRNDDLLIKMDTVNKILNKISELEEGGNTDC